MAGGMRSQRDGVPLGDRARGALGPAASAGAGHDSEGRPCWLRLAQPVPGTVHAWRRAADGQWCALVVAWVPADRVRPRE